ncbi:MAG: tetratricopeptide repeat protein [Gammaproteobacteria bacterium]|nr:tetratricopeptide repeat protein [Gammaproteobacteria bacterium]
MALALVGIDVVGVNQSLAEELRLDQRQTQVLVEKTEVLEAEIEIRQQQMAVQPTESKEYQSGFEDGYNKAIVDLLKSKLLNDPTLSPKPKGAGLHAKTRATDPATQPQRPQYPPQHMAPASEAIDSPVVPGKVPAAASSAPLATVETMRSSAGATAGGVGAIEAISRSATTATAKDSRVTGSTPTQMVRQQNSTVETKPQSLPQSMPQQTTQESLQNPLPINGEPSPAAAPVPVQTGSQAVTRATTQSTAETTPQATANTTLQQSPQQGINRKTARQWLEQSNEYVAQKNWQQAIRAATQALALDAGVVDAYVVRSWAYAENGQNQQALQDIGSAIKLDPDNAVAHNNRAYIYELLNDSHKAQQEYQQACSLGHKPACDTANKLGQVIKQSHANIEELTNLSYRQFQQKNWQGVIETTTRLLTLDPENSVALVNRAGAFTELGLYSKALDDCNTALIVDPDMAIAYNNKGYVLELMGELKKAAMEYETACVLGVQQSCSDFKRLSQKVSAR